MDALFALEELITDAYSDAEPTDESSGLWLLNCALYRRMSEVCLQGGDPASALRYAREALRFSIAVGDSIAAGSHPLLRLLEPGLTRMAFRTEPSSPSGLKRTVYELLIQSSTKAEEWDEALNWAQELATLEEESRPPPE